MLLLFPILDYPEAVVSSDQWHKPFCTTWSVKNVHERIAIWRQSWPFSLYSVANISKNMLAIIHNVSHWVPLGVTKCIHGFLIVFFCGFPDVYWSDNVFCTWGWILTLTCLQMFFQILSSCVVNHFSRGLMRYVEGFQCIDGPFRVYMSPLTLFLCLFHVDLKWSINARG